MNYGLKTCMWTLGIALYLYHMSSHPSHLPQKCYSWHRTCHRFWTRPLSHWPWALPEDLQGKGTVIQCISFSWRVNGPQGQGGLSRKAYWAGADLSEKSIWHCGGSTASFGKRSKTLQTKPIKKVLPGQWNPKVLPLAEEASLTSMPELEQDTRRSTTVLFPCFL